MGEDIVIPIFHAQQEHDAAVPIAVAQMVLIENGLGKILNVVLADGTHGEDAHGDAVLFRQLSRLLLQRLRFGFRQKIGRVRHVGQRVLVRRQCGEAGEEGEQQHSRRQEQKNSFHLVIPAFPPAQSSLLMISITANTAAQIPPNQAQKRPLEVGRSPTSFPVWPFMAK